MPVMPGAEPFTHLGGTTGALLMKNGIPEGKEYPEVGIGENNLR